MPDGFDSNLSIQRQGDDGIRSMLEHTTAVVYIKDLHGRYLLTNRQFVLTFARDAQQSPFDDFDLLPRHEAEAVRRNDESVVAAGAPCRFIEHITLSDGVHQFTAIRFPLRDQTGRINGVCGIATDLTEGNRAHRALQEAKEQVSTILESITDAFVSMDTQWRFVHVNQTAATMLRCEREQMEGRVIWDLIPQLRGTAFDAEFRRSVATGEPVQFETYSRALGVWLECRCYPSPQGLSVFLTDTTGRKRWEEQLKELNETLEKRVRERTEVAEQRARQLRALAAELSDTEQRERRRLAQVLHDHLQQMLVAAKINLNMLQGRCNDDRLADAFDEINDLLDQSIQESRSLTGELCPPVLYEADFPVAIEWLARHMQDKHGLTVRVRSSLPDVAIAESVRVLMFTAVRELLCNTVKHANVAEAWVRLSCTRAGELRVEVSDRGAGFDPDQLHQNHSAFGLFSIRERLTLLGGRIRVRSARGKGVRITLLAPMSQPEGKAASVATASSKPALADAISPIDRPSRSGKTRVLIADDHKILREGLASLLQSQHDITIVAQASDGRMAVELAHQTHPDIVIMDVNMPVMNGVEATRRISRELPHVCVIGLSMHEEKDMAATMRAAGAATYLNKDGPGDALVEAIRRCMKSGDEHKACLTADAPVTAHADG